MRTAFPTAGGEQAEASYAKTDRHTHQRSVPASDYHTPPLLEPLDFPDTAEVHDLRRPLARSATVEPLSDRFTNQSVARFAALPNGLVHLFDQLIVEVDTD